MFRRNMLAPSLIEVCRVRNLSGYIGRFKEDGHSGLRGGGKRGQNPDWTNRNGGQ
jgi:hypothetical protein